MTEENIKLPVSVVDYAKSNSINGKTILVRVDFNVPIENGVVSGDTRIKRSLDTINFLIDQKAKIILISHIEGKGGDSLRPVYDFIKNTFPVSFVEDILGEEGQTAISKLIPGEVILAENIRMYPEEKKNDIDFSKKLASLADIYVNDAFSVSHRSHASIVGVPQFVPHFAGLLLIDEIVHLQKIFHPKHPFVFILGGAKFDTKLPLIQKFLSVADHVFVGGALANDIFKAKGFNVGASLVSDMSSVQNISNQIFSMKDFIENPKLVTPSDVVVQKEGIKGVDGCVIKKTNEVLEDEVIFDSGPETVEFLKKLVSESKCVLWNGPLGNYEEGFTGPTIELAKIIAETGVDGAVGGGDTLAAINTLGDTVESKINFISTGGGAMLQYLLDETLVGIDALK